VLKVLYGYPWFSSKAYGDIKGLLDRYIDRLNCCGFDVESFCLTLDPPGPCLTYKQLDAKWRWGDKQLMDMYSALTEALAGKDVFINSAGINLHPEFVSSLPVFTVFQCFDDPENSENLSKPVAAAYDLCLVGNIAELDSYRSWGAKQVAWTPMGLQPTIYDGRLTYQDILEGKRDIDLFLMMDRTFPARKRRLDQLAAAFPAAHFYGKGWPRGFLAPQQEVAFLQRSKIGPNLHNSTGPINYRTFYLPANGVMQICDNKSHLGQIFQLGEEAVGFDSVQECIELCRYYLEHDEERRRIAANGWQRAINDYNEVAVFSRNLQLIQEQLGAGQLQKKPEVVLVSHYRATNTRRLAHRLFATYVVSARRKQYLRRHYRRLKGSVKKALTLLFHPIQPTLAISTELLEETVRKYQAQDWFIYAAKDRANRWHVCAPSRWIVQNVAKQAIIFETGAGCGLNLLWFAQQGFTHLMGSDLDVKAVSAGRELSAAMNLPIDLWEDDGLNPRMVPDEIDILLALNWTYHVPGFRLADFLRRYRNHIAFQGYLIVDLVDSRFNRIANNQFLTADWHKPLTDRRPSEYISRYSIDDVRTLAQESGYSIEKIMQKKAVIPRVVYVLRKT